jgi:hypothetical protein
MLQTNDGAAVMIIRQALNFTAHLVAGIAVGALAVVAIRTINRRDKNEDRRPEEFDEKEGTIEHP